MLRIFAGLRFSFQQSAAAMNMFVRGTPRASKSGYAEVPLLKPIRSRGNL
jgi:hypothetical protein